MAAPAPTSFKKTIIRSQPKPVSSSFTKDTQFWDSFEVYLMHFFRKENDYEFIYFI